LTSPDTTPLVLFPDLPLFALDVKCGGGTYVRSLIADAAQKADSAAHMVNDKEPHQTTSTHLSFLTPDIRF
jgi:tRNA U55 pseudouridine synthase TruB